MRLAARGGSSEITGHGMIDLLSFKRMINGERMITDQAGGSGVSYTKRGHHIYDRSIHSKSTLFVEGLGCFENARCDSTETVKGNNILGLRIDGSHIYLPRWKDIFIGRLFLLVDSKYWLVIDRVYPNTWSCIESRFHTDAEYKCGKDWATLKSGKEKMSMTFFSLDKSIIQESRGMPSMGGQQT